MRAVNMQLPSNSLESFRPAIKMADYQTIAILQHRTQHNTPTALATHRHTGTPITLATHRHTNQQRHQHAHSHFPAVRHHSHLHMCAWARATTGHCPQERTRISRARLWSAKRGDRLSWRRRGQSLKRSRCAELRTEVRGTHHVCMHA